MAELAVSDPIGIEECRQRLDEDGYVVMRGVVSPERLQRLGRDLTLEYERARSTGVLFKGGGTLTGHLNCFPGAGSRFVYDELESAGVVELVRRVRPDIVDQVRATMNFNLPGSVAQHYHADDLYTEEFLICNVAVVDTTEHNGALDVLPGTHKRFYKFWRYALERKYLLSTRVPMQCGDAVLRRSTLWHRGTPNRSSYPRPMMAITFGERWSNPSDDPFTVNGGAAYFFPNWYSTGRLGQLRERVYVKAPITYSTYRFVRSLWGNKGYSSW
jgi:ectoine hydroxylase-related dioxygenase (phytanoyl-CoA dioxygenase family)